MRTLAEYEKMAVIAHGHLCAGQILGCMAIHGLELLAIGEPEGLRVMTDSELFQNQWVRMELGPEEFPGYKKERIECAECGEGISFGRQVVRGGRTLCRTCAGDCYYKPL